MTKDLDDYVRQVCVEAKLASKGISTADHKAKDHALLAIAAKIRKSKNEILAANEKDLKAGANLEDALLDRLTLNPNRIESMASGCEVVTTNLGALYETCAPFGTFVSFGEDLDDLENRYAKVLSNSIKNFWSDSNQKKLKLQSEVINNEYSWDKRKIEWQEFFNMIRVSKN